MGIKNGLSNSRVIAISTDQKGFLWFGTASGLNRFDGYDFKIFLHNEKDTTSINDNYVDKIIKGPLHSLWIYTPKGWNKYDLKSEKFESRPRSWLSRIGLPHEWFKTIVSDPFGNFWFLYPGEGIYKYITKSRQSYLFNMTNSLHPLYSNDISSLTFDPPGNLWVVYANGMIEVRRYSDHRLIKRYSISENISSQDYQIFIDAEGDVWVYVPGKKNPVYWYKLKEKVWVVLDTYSKRFQLNNDIVNGIVQDDQGKIWIATDHGGINVVDKSKESIHYISNDFSIKEISPSNAIKSLLKDPSGTIWMGTFKSGINSYNQTKSSFPHFRHNPKNSTSLPFDDVNCFAEDQVGNLWIGTNGRGLLYFDRVKQTFTTYLQGNKGNGLSSNIISSLYVDRDNKLWIGTYFGGLNCYDGKQFIQYRHHSKIPHSLSDDSVWEIFEDRAGRLWIGTLNNGMQLLDRKTNKFIDYRYDHPFNYSVNAIIEDRKENLWVGGSAGIEFYDKNRKLLQHFAYEQGIENSICNTTVLDIIEDARGWIWIATRDGLSIYNPEKKKFFKYHKIDGLPHQTILRLIKDKKNNIWASTPNGLSKITAHYSSDQVRLSFRNYDETDGLQGNTFNDDAAFITRSGELVFGGSNGFNLFFPPSDQLKRKNYPLFFTDLQLFNNSVRVGQKYNGQVILSESISATQKLSLQYDQNAIAIQFAALNYIDPGKITYSYQLQGLHDKWVTVDGNNRKISFTGLTPGSYTLVVRAEENGVINPVYAKLEIKILPPFWASTWAYVFYVLVIVIGLCWSRYRIISSARIKFKKEQQELEQLRRQELDAMKIHFFTNVSHELKTPLSLIITPIEKFLEQAFPENESRQFRLIHRNARRLLNMVDQLLDFRKLELGELHVHKKTARIFEFCKEVFETFSDLAEKRNIHFSFSIMGEEREIEFDPDKIERILFNLLTNAFKFTQEGGHVTLSVRNLDNKSIEIRVIDTGIGIANDKLELIFERFYQNKMPDNIMNQGSGIGLSISREFAKLHQGTLHAESQIGQGSEFILRLAIQSEPDHKIIPKGTVIPVEDRKQALKKTVLLVEDNEDYRHYMKEFLEPYFNIIVACNGKEGWQRALSEHPDLIVSDLNMPEMNGAELCQKVKADKRTAFIPVILLTVVSSEHSQLQGLEKGANDYITKPFRMEMLISKMKNLLTQQDRFKETYQTQVSVTTSELDTTSADKEWIKKVLTYIEANMGNSSLSVQGLGEEFAVGRATLYRKIFELTGKTPVEFIRSVRLQRAQHMLETKQWSIAEIAYQVGFTDPKYFSKVFREEFGITPSTYQEKHR